VIRPCVVRLPLSGPIDVRPGARVLARWAGTGWLWLCNGVETVVPREALAAVVEGPREGER